MARQRRPGLRKKGRIWHIEKVIPGYGRFRESTSETDYGRAERYFDKRVEELRQISVYGERPKVTLVEAAEKFLREECPPKSVERAGYALAQVLPVVGHLLIQDVYDETLRPFKDTRRESVLFGGHLRCPNPSLLGFTYKVITYCFYWSG